MLPVTVARVHCTRPFHAPATRVRAFLQLCASISSGFLTWSVSASVARRYVGLYARYLCVSASTEGSTWRSRIDVWESAGYTTEAV